MKIENHRLWRGPAKSGDWKLKIIAVCPFFLLGIAAFLLAWLPVRGLAPVFGAMDELGNYHLARYFAEHTSLKIPELLNSIAPGLVAPGWIQAHGSNLVPGGFAGLPFLFGIVAKVVGVATLPLLPPILFATGVVAFAWLVGFYTKRSVGIIAGIFYMVAPPVWHFAIHGFFPNVPFFSLLIVAAALLQVGRKRGYGYEIAGSIILALAVLIRPSESIWVAPVFIGLTWRERRWTISVIAMAVALVGSLGFNWYFYGNPFIFAYSNLLVREYITGAREVNPSFLWKVLSPFGINLREAGVNFWYNFLRFRFLPLWGAVGAALVLVRWRFLDSTRRWFLFSVSVVAAWAVVVYGSFDAIVSEGVDPLRVVVASPIGRYWLPLWALTAVLASWGWDFLTEYYPRWARRAMAIGLAGLIVISSAQVVVFDAHHGIEVWRRTNQAYAAWQKELLNVVSSDTVIVSGKMNRITWPARSTIFTVQPDQVEMFQRLAQQKNVVIIASRLMYPPDRTELVKNNYQRYHGVPIEKVGEYGFGTLYRVMPNAQ